MRPLSNREKTYVVVFIFALAWGLWNYRHLIVNSPSSTSVIRPATHVAASLITPSLDIVPERADALPNYVPDWGPDPFHRAWRNSGTAAVPLSTAKARPSGAKLKLSAIVDRPEGRYAVINGAIVREGGMVEGRRVTKIESSRVVVDDNGTEVTLSL